MAHSAHAPTPDTVTRAMTNDGSYRILVAETTETVRAVLAAQEVDPSSRSVMAEVITAAILIRETMAPANRVQLIYAGGDGSQLVGDAYPEGKTRGLARILDPALGFRGGEGGRFQVERMIRAGHASKGIVETVADEGVSDALHRYFSQSEQVETIVDLAYREHDGAVVAAGGYVVQLLPELTDPPRQAMIARLAQFGALADHFGRGGAAPDRVLAALLDGVEHTVLATSTVEFHCPCDRGRVLTATTALGQEEIESLLKTGEELKVHCDYCRELYILGESDYREILGRQG